MTNAMIGMKVYKFIGTTDEITTCGCCGRTDLKGTIVLQEIDGGAFVFFGSVCGSKATGWTTKEVKRTAKQADTDRKNAYNAAINSHPLTQQIHEEITAANAVVPRMTFTDRKPLMARWREMGAQVKAEVDAQFAVANN